MCYYCPDLLHQVTAACWSFCHYTERRESGVEYSDASQSGVTHQRSKPATKNQPLLMRIELLPHFTGDKVSLPGHSPPPPTNPPGYWPPNGVNSYIGHSPGHQCAFSWPTLHDVHHTIHRGMLSTSPFPIPHTITGVWSSPYMLWDDGTGWNVVCLM